MMFLRYFTFRWFCLRFSVRNLFVISAILAFCMGSGMAAPRHQKKHVAGKHHARHVSHRRHYRHHRRRRVSWRRRGQQSILPDRAREIQEALIRERYLTGEPTGRWDKRTKEAMIRYQADNGWQTKVAPDSRALIKLGLGPDYSKQQVLNLQPGTDALASNAAASRVGAAGQDK